MIEEYLSDLDDEKVEMLKYTSLFVGGFILGYSVNKIFSSTNVDNIKSNAVSMIRNYFNPEIEYVEDFNDEIIDD